MSVQQTASTFSVGELPEIDVFSAEFRSTPWEVARRALADSPNGLARSTRGIEAITYQACHTLFSDRRLKIGFDEMYAATGFDGSSAVFRSAVTSINNLEGDQHRNLRTVLGGYFNREWVQALRPTVNAIIEDLVHGFGPGEPVDLAAEFTPKIPSRLFTRLIGVPLADAEFLERMSDLLLTVVYMDPANNESIEAAYRELADYVNGLIEDKQRTPGDDVVSYLLAAERAGTISRHDVVVNTTALLRASTDTTSGQLGLVLAELANRPDLWKLCHADPAVIPAAVMEAVRWRTGAWSILRIAREELEVLDTVIPAGTELFGLAVTAHRDQDAYPEPELFRVDRKRPKPTLNWGMGLHYCLGKPIAQVEMEEAVRVLTRRWAEIDFATPFETRGEPFTSQPARMEMAFSVR
ncbi:cytochrome P450 [Streptomyces fuscichromogenes]|uniref:cytochrome P450 n=1 Tax=Streptomyces fuscichromogenes TaxID=1324013 RepID=UPI00382BA75D